MLKPTNFYIAACDPGKTGALVVLDEKCNVAMVTVFDGLPDTSLYDFFSDMRGRFGNLVLYKEDFAAFGVNAKTSFTVGRIHGCIDMSCQKLEIPVRVVRPKDWQNLVCDQESNELKPKVRTALTVKRLFPDTQLNARGQKKPHSGIIDALLIGVYGVRKELAMRSSV